MLDHFRRMLAYDSWANARVIGCFVTLPAPDERLLALLTHLLTSKRMWLGRIEGTEDGNLNTWPQLSFEQCVALEGQMRQRWEAYLGGLSDGEELQTVHYVTAAGEPGQQTVGDIVTHKFLHAMYHRGQITQRMRELGGTPVGTDFVVWTKAVREQGA